MIGFIVIELALLVLQWIIFLVMISFVIDNKQIRLVPWWNLRESRQLGGVGIVGILESASLLALATDHAPPLWIYAILFGLINGVTLRWMWLVWLARRNISTEMEK